MPILTDSRALAAAETVENILEGKYNRVLQENSKVSVAQVCDADVSSTVIVGRELLMDDQLTLIESVAGGSPRNPEDILVQTVGTAGEEVIIKVRNRDTVGGQNVRTTVYIEPI